MGIIKNLIKRNKLNNELSDIEQSLRINGYYEKQRQLSRLIYKPDEYVKLYIEINDEYGNLINRQKAIEKQLQKLSGINLCKNQKFDNITKF